VTKRHKTEAAAEYLGVPVETLKYWRLRGRGPKYRKLPNGKVDYTERDLDAFSDEHVIDPREAA
jgi:DNA-binding transcriptional MerR regulator